MENNRFYENRMEIKALSEETGVDLDVASTMYAKEHGWTGWQEEMYAWKAEQRKYIKHPTKTLADLFR